MRSRESYFTLEFLADELGSCSFFPPFQKGTEGGSFCQCFKKANIPCLLINNIHLDYVE